jgi:hypothetical protein
MNPGKLNTRIQIKQMSKTGDGFGGWTSSVSNYIAIWAKFSELSGIRETTDGQRQTRTEVELICRSDTINFIKDNIGGQEWFFEIEGNAKDYRINEIYESDYKNHSKIKGTKIE